MSLFSFHRKDTIPLPRDLKSLATIVRPPGGEKPVVLATSESFQRGFALYGTRLDKSWSLTDCISIEVTRSAQATDSLTYHQHFEQAESPGASARQAAFVARAGASHYHRRTRDFAHFKRTFMPIP